MLKYNSKTKEVAVKGKLQDIAADVLCIVGAMYGEYLKKNPEAAEMFKYIMASEVADEEFWRGIEEETKKSPN